MIRGTVILLLKLKISPFSLIYRYLLLFFKKIYVFVVVVVVVFFVSFLEKREMADILGVF
jgi:hypothetical protein